MESYTKNKQSETRIAEMIQRAFGDVTAVRVEELKEGFFNAAYGIELSNGQEVILKIAPSRETRIMTHEKEIMRSEITAMRLLAEQTEVPVASVLFEDNSLEVCEAEYFFMTKLPGSSYHSRMNELSDADKAAIDYQVGQLTARMNGIKSERFGYFGQADRQGTKWFEVFKSIVQDVIADAEAMTIDLGISTASVVELLDQHRVYFEEVTTPSFVHWDIWPGNVFLVDNTVSGIIDFERCLWADPLMEVGFRSYARNQHFLDGYGLATLRVHEQIRCQWYDLYVFLIAGIECDYRQYPDRGMYEWATRMLKEVTAALAGAGEHTAHNS